MAHMMGKNSRIALGSTTIARMRSFSLAINGEVVDISELGTLWAKNDEGVKSWTANCEGMIDLDSTSNVTIIEAAENSNSLTNLRFYLDTTNYYEIDQTDSDAFAKVTSFTINSDNNSVVSFSCTFTGSGKIVRNT